MNPALLAALVNEIAVPELTSWLRSLHANRTPLTDDLIIQKLVSDTDLGIKLGEAWLASHPTT